ncbi:hypothetical protein AHW55_22960 [Salmonella enterica subsp. enterica serovar Montevideo]|nr:hypothetical protein [Salmonella enterica]ECZ5385813.1 hypothetical protein [Salmonella enterica subsp. enterica serovar Montevideo]
MDYMKGGLYGLMFFSPLCLASNAGIPDITSEQFFYTWSEGFAGVLFFWLLGLGIGSIVKMISKL